jgi:hypothetical protein
VVLALEPAHCDGRAALHHPAAARVDLGDAEVGVEDHQVGARPRPDAALAVVQSQQARHVEDEAARITSLGKSHQPAARSHKPANLSRLDVEVMPTE